MLCPGRRGVPVPIGFHDDHGGDDESQHVRHGHGPQHPVQPQEYRQQQGKAHAEHHLPEHGQHGGGQGLAHRLQEDEAGLVHAGQHHHAQVHPEGPDGEVRVVDALVLRAEDGDQLAGEALRQHQGHQAHQSLHRQQAGEQRPHPVLFLRTHIIPHNGDAACRHAHHDGNDDLEEFHDDAHHRHGDLGILLLAEHRVQGPVFAQHVVDGRHGRHQADLGEEAGDAQRQHPAADLPLQGEVPAAGADDLHMKQIPHRKGRRYHLANHRGHRRAHHAPLAAEDENRVQDDVQHRPGQGGDHGEAGAAVGPDHRVHGLAEHIKRDAQGDVEEILLRTAEGLLVDGAAEHGDDAIGEDQIHRRQHQAGGYRQCLHCGRPAGGHCGPGPC